MISLVDRPFDLDWLVIGSGFGGSVMAYRLAEQKKLGVLAGTLFRHTRPFIEVVSRVHDGAIGRIVAALEVCSGRAIADPFVATAGVVELLDLRAAQVRR